jgi:hypothetical protein
MTTAAVECTAAPVTEPAAIRRARIGGIEIYLRAALARAPQTTRQLQDSAPDVPHQFIHSCGRPGCRGHLAPIAWYRIQSGDMQRILVRWERQGVAQRVIMDGWQGHLWALGGAS